MDDDLLYTNKFISDPRVNAGYGMTQELRKHKLRETQTVQELSAAPEELELLENDILKSNPVMTDENQLKPLNAHGILKEKRTVVCVDSNQRSFFTTENLELGDETAFSAYFDPDDFEQFQNLWRLLAGAEEELQTYAEYAAENEVSITSMGSVSDACRELVRSLVEGSGDGARSLDLFSRTVDATQTNSEVNSSLLALLLQIANVNAFSGNFALVNSLNAYAMAAASVNPDYFWRPFFYDSTEQQAKIIVYNERSPNSYRITLPRIVSHIKSIRLISTEIPNTVHNITARNNIMTLNLRYRSATTDASLTGNGLYPYRPVELDTDRAIFNFILVKLNIGLYDMDSLIAHMETQLNDAVAYYTCRRFAKVFKVSWVQETGVVEIKCMRSELEFHLKFYSRLTEVQKIYDASNTFSGHTHGIITEYARDLWYMLGFPWPYQIDTDTTDKYTQLLTNVVSYGAHPVFAADHPDNDLFDRIDEDDEFKSGYLQLTDEDNLFGNTKYEIIQSKRPHRYPSITSKYIYLVIKGYKSMDHINQHNNVVEFTERDFFAKVLLDADTGKIAYNTFVSSPLIFTNIIDRIERLDVTWVDDHGDLVDFGDVDHSFTLEFIHYVTQNDVNSYNTKIGIIDQKSYPEYLV